MVADLCLLAIVFTAGYCVGASVSARQPAGPGVVPVAFGTILRRRVCGV